MWLLWVAVALAVLRGAGIGWFAGLSWWWVGLLFGAAFLWFEFFEKWLGLEKKRAMDEMAATRKRRIERALRQKTPPRR